MVRQEEEEDDIVCLDESFFINDNYQLTNFTFGSHVLQLFCLQSASTDFDLTGQLVWPGAMLLNDYLSKNAEMLQGCSMIELGSGVDFTGLSDFIGNLSICTDDIICFNFTICSDQCNCCCFTICNG
ncbi:hypothetical protein REPUB_Repub05bG0118800 [Reevesia pubescens]